MHQEAVGPTHAAPTLWGGFRATHAQALLLRGAAFSLAVLLSAVWLQRASLECPMQAPLSRSSIPVHVHGAEHSQQLAVGEVDGVPTSWSGSPPWASTSSQLWVPVRQGREWGCARGTRSQLGEGRACLVVGWAKVEGQGRPSGHVGGGQGLGSLTLLAQHIRQLLLPWAGDTGAFLFVPSPPQTLAPWGTPRIYTPNPTPTPARSGCQAPISTVLPLPLPALGSPGGLWPPSGSL